MRAGIAWITTGLLAVAACGGSDEDSGGAAEDGPDISITDVTVGDARTAVVGYSIDDDGEIRVEIDWGDGSALEGFTGERGTFSSRHVYETDATSMIVTIVATDADGNSSTATSSVDLGSSASSTTGVASVPASSAVATTVSASSTDAPVATTTTPAATPATTSAPTPTTPAPTSTVTTTTLEPRQSRATVRGSRINVIGDCDSVGGQGDFVFVARAQIVDRAVDSKTYGSRLDTLQLGSGDSIEIEDLVAGASPFDPGDDVVAVVSLTASEVDVGGNDSDMDDVTREATETLRVREGQPEVEFLTVGLGSGDCEVELVAVVEVEPL